MSPSMMRLDRGCALFLPSRDSIRFRAAHARSCSLLPCALHFLALGRPHTRCLLHARLGNSQLRHVPSLLFPLVTAVLFCAVLFPMRDLGTTLAPFFIFSLINRALVSFHHSAFLSHLRPFYRNPWYIALWMHSGPAWALSFERGPDPDPCPVSHSTPSPRLNFRLCLVCLLFFVFVSLPLHIVAFYWLLLFTPYLTFPLCPKAVPTLDLSNDLPDFDLICPPWSLCRSLSCRDTTETKCYRTRAEQVHKCATVVSSCPLCLSVRSRHQVPARKLVRSWQDL